MQVSYGHAPNSDIYSVRVDFSYNNHNIRIMSYNSEKSWRYDVRLYTGWVYGHEHEDFDTVLKRAKNRIP